jgi:tripartite-type tricarboxylate transporter receptor subunit TctC
MPALHTWSHRGVISALAWLVMAVAAIAAEYPEKMIQVIVPFGAGTGTDAVARQIFGEIAKRTGQTIVVDNKAGADGQLGAQAAALAKPDGYTVFVTTQTTQAYNAHAYRTLPYDPVKSFAPVTTITMSPLLLVVRDDLPARTVTELIALAKAAPGTLTFGSGNGSSRGAGELFRTMSGVDLLNVPYKSQTQAIVDLMGGRIDISFTDLPALQSGKVRALATTGLERIATLADIPTVAEAGLPGYELNAWAAVYMPAGTPAAIVERLNSLVHQAVKSDAYQEHIRQSGAKAFVGSPEELAAFQSSETARWAKIIRGAGLQQQ